MKPSKEKKRNKNIKQRVEAAQKCCSIPFSEPSQFHIVWYDHQSPWLCLWEWECINFHASLGHRAHLLHCYCNPHMHTHTHTTTVAFSDPAQHTQLLFLSLCLSNACTQPVPYSLNCTPSIRPSEMHTMLCQTRRISLISSFSLSLWRTTHTHTHRSIVVYVASGQDYELNLPLSCTSLLLPSRTSDLWISQLKKRKSLYGHIVNVSGKIVMKCTLKSLFVQNGTERLFFLNSKPSPSLVKDLILKYVIICLDDLRCHLW